MYQNKIAQARDTGNGGAPAHLPYPKFESYYGTLWNADSLDVLRALPDNSVDFIFTSPPYNIGMNYDGYNDSLEHQMYADKLEKIFRECYRVLTTGGRMALNVPFCLKDKVTKEIKLIDYIVHSIVEKTDFKMYDKIIWVKSGSASQYDSGTNWGSWCKPSAPNMRSLGEAVNVYYKESRKYVKPNGVIDITEEEFKLYTNNVWFFRQPRRKYKHPCPFSIKMVKAAIRLFTYVNDVVLDPFAGIGSTALAAIQTKRRFMAIEISPKYFNIAKQRIMGASIDTLF